MADAATVLAVSFQAAPNFVAVYPDEPSEPHWYLAALGVSDGLRGQGIGSVLLAAGVARAERTKRPCYLETFSEANVRFCQRYGFDWFMQRPFSAPSSVYLRRRTRA